MGYGVTWSSPSRAATKLSFDQCPSALNWTQFTRGPLHGPHTHYYTAALVVQLMVAHVYLFLVALASNQYDALFAVTRTWRSTLWSGKQNSLLRSASQLSKQPARASDHRSIPSACAIIDPPNDADGNWGLNRVQMAVYSRV